VPYPRTIGLVVSFASDAGSGYREPIIRSSEAGWRGPPFRFAVRRDDGRELWDASPRARSAERLRGLAQGIGPRALCSLGPHFRKGASSRSSLQASGDYVSSFVSPLFSRRFLPSTLALCPPWSRLGRDWMAESATDRAFPRGHCFTRVHTLEQVLHCVEVRLRPATTTIATFAWGGVFLDLDDVWMLVSDQFSCFGRELEELGYWIVRDRVQEEKGESTYGRNYPAG
jgi:hypothetical protein